MGLQSNLKQPLITVSLQRNELTILVWLICERFKALTEKMPPRHMEAKSGHFDIV